MLCEKTVGAVRLCNKDQRTLDSVWGLFRRLSFMSKEECEMLSKLKVQSGYNAQTNRFEGMSAG